MLGFVSGKASERKLHLYAVACCRRVGHLMTDPRHRNAVEAAERFADGLLTEADFEQALQPVVALWGELPDAKEGERTPYHSMTAATRHLEKESCAFWVADFAARGRACLAGPDGSPGWLAARQAESAGQCELLRDLFGNPSHPFQFDPDWLSGEGSAAVERARQIYTERRFESLPSLADVLEQAGCRDRAVLEHCRGAGPHTRGCWVLDALLGRETAVRRGLVTDTDWRTCVDPTPLLYFLRDKGSARKWRLFAVACCRRIGHLIADERSRRAVEVAARYADAAATEDELEAARSAAQQALAEAKDAEYTAEAEANFCITPAYAAVCSRLHATSAARSAVCPDPRETDSEPGTSDARYWRPSHAWAAAAVTNNVTASFGSGQYDDRGEEAKHAAEAAEAAELQAQCELLRDLFGEYLGRPREEGDWLPCTVKTRVSPRSGVDQWCLLPTPRNLALRREWLAWDSCTVPRLAQAIYEVEAFDRLPILADALEDAGCDLAELLEHLRGPQPHARGCWALDLILGKR
jgi:hypothetical protein